MCGGFHHSASESGYQLNGGGRFVSSASVTRSGGGMGTIKQQDIVISFLPFPQHFRQSYIGWYAINTVNLIINVSLLVKRTYRFAGMQCQLGRCRSSGGPDKSL